jgi:hypothetical protein
MAQDTLQDVLIDLGASIDQDTALPTGTDLAVRARLADRAQQDWGEFYTWNDLRITLQPTALLSATSIGLPDNFDRLSSPLYNVATNPADKYIELTTPSDRFKKLSTDKYVYIIGQPGANALIINPALPSGVSLVLDYQSAPSSLVTLADVVQAPREYLAKRVEYYILFSRSDPRFTFAKQASDDFLRGRVEDQDVPTGGQDNRVPDSPRSTGFRIGRD